jgi:hypothetical protein
MNSWLRILSHSVGNLFILAIISLDVQKLSNLMQSHLSIHAPIPWQLESYSENNCLCLYLQVFSLFFCSVSKFQVLH